MVKVDPGPAILTTENYWSWASDMETLLLEKDLDECIVRPGKNLPPEEQRKDKKALVKSLPPGSHQ